MRSILIYIVLLALLGGSWYLYRDIYAVCKTPIRYSVNILDERFNLTYEEALKAVRDAERIWEDAIGKDLFIYDQEGSLSVNFVYDERQRLTDTEQTLREILDRKETITEDLKSSYDALVGEYEGAREIYEKEIAAYEARLAVYNEEVGAVNESGGADPETFERLEVERVALDEENTRLNAAARSLNKLVDELNQLGSEGNRAIEDYNQNIHAYNNLNHPEEFTQGDYQRDTINVYQFENPFELRLVLAHELGHALSLGHVENESSIMYYLLEGQHEKLEVSLEDLEEYGAICDA